MRIRPQHRRGLGQNRMQRKLRAQLLRTSKLQVEMLEERRLLAADFISNEILVQFESDATPEMRAQIRPAGSVLAETIHTAMMQRSGAGVIEKITLDANMTVEQAVDYFSTQDGVLAAEPNYVYDIAAISNDTYYTNGSLWGMYSRDAALTPGVPSNTFGSQAEKAWDNNQLGSSNVYVGIIDTGIQYTHPDLVDNMWTNPFDPVDGIDNVGRDHAVIDESLNPVNRSLPVALADEQPNSLESRTQKVTPPPLCVCRSRARPTWCQTLRV